MKRLNKLQALLLVFVLPTVLRLIILPFDNLVILTIVTVLTYGLIGLWYYGLLTIIKEKVGIAKNEEITIKTFVTLLVIYPLLTIFLYETPLTKIPTSMILGNMIFAALGLISIYLLTINFEKFLRTKEITNDKLAIFIFLAVYPIGIWKYQDTLKSDKEASAQQNV